MLGNCFVIRIRGEKGKPGYVIRHRGVYGSDHHRDKLHGTLDTTSLKTALLDMIHELEEAEKLAAATRAASSIGSDSTIPVCRNPLSIAMHGTM